MFEYIDKRNTHFENYIISPANNLGLVNTINDIYEETKKGKQHLLITKYQQKYGNSLSCNITIPYTYKDEKKVKIIKDLVIINNPEDAERIANTHIKKMPNLKPFLYDSIISTTDIMDWKQQRKNFQPAFSVNNELKKIIPLSNKRAEYSIQLLDMNISANNISDNEVNISEFFLNETQAQLQLALFGFSNKFQKETNKKIRDSFNGIDIKYARQFSFDLLNETKKSSGPLSLAFQNRKTNNKKELFGNALIFTFAGHDTTANTLTWLIYELCNNLGIQERLQQEIDLFWYVQKDKLICYEDLKRLPFMTTCIMETLRLWSPIPNGTYRELIKDDYIIGINNEKVILPKGTYVQIPNWSRHRNPELWGEDANIFNPDREFRDDEIWNGEVLSSYNPSSKRFSPFTYGPRDCIGKNFSQMEMRIILVHLLRKYSFQLSHKQLHSYKKEDIGINKFTLGPMDYYDRDKIGLYVNISNRHTKKKQFKSKL